MHLIEHCHDLPADGTRLLVAVSGGCDSMVLLDLLRCAGRWPLHVYHLDHQLRVDSPLDAQLLRDYCAEHALALTCEMQAIADLAEQEGRGIEVCARDYRYERLQEIARLTACTWILTAHHRDDQAESILMHIFRGAHAHGLAGMRVQRPIGDCHLLRPLLRLSRQDLRDYAVTQTVPWREDSSNADERYRRNFIRRSVLPQFEQGCPGFTEALVQRAEHHRQQLDAFDARLDKHWDDIVARSEVSIAQLQFWSLTLRGIFWRRLLMHLRLPLSRAHIHRCEQLLFGESSQRFNLSDYTFIKNELVIAWFQERSGSECVYAFHDTVRVDDVTFTRTAASPLDPRTLSPMQAALNPAAIKGDLQIRCIRAGERWQPFGAPGHKNVYQYLSDKKCPQQKRARLWVVADDEGVLWIPGYTIADRAQVQAQGLLLACRSVQALD